MLIIGIKSNKKRPLLVNKAEAKLWKRQKNPKGWYIATTLKLNHIYK